MRTVRGAKLEKDGICNSREMGRWRTLWPERPSLCSILGVGRCRGRLCGVEIRRVSGLLDLPHLKSLKIVLAYGAVGR
jgi:hypothetical protein